MQTMTIASGLSADQNNARSFWKKFSGRFSNGRPVANGKAPPEATDAQTLGVLDSLSDPIAVINAHGTITLVNAAWRALTQHDHEDAAWIYPAGRNYLEILEKCSHHGKSDDAACALAGIKAVLSGARRTFDLDYICTPNAPRWFHMEVTRHSEEAGAIILQRETTARVLDTMHQSQERRLRDLVWNQTSDGLCIVNPDGLIVDCNAPIEKRTGMTREQMFGKPATTLFSTRIPINTSKVRREVEEAGQARLVGRYEYSDGSMHTMDTRIFPLRDEMGNFIGRIALSRDVTDKEKRQEMQQIHSAIWEQSPDGFAVTETDGRVVSANAALLNLLECTQEAIVGKDIAPFLTDPSSEPFNVERLAALDEQGAKVRRRLRLPSGKERNVKISVSALKLDLDEIQSGNRILIVVRDVSELTRASVELQSVKDLLSRTEAAARVGGLELDWTTDTVLRTDGMYRIYDIDIGDLKAAEAFRDSWSQSPEIVETMELARTSDAPWQREFQIRTAKGRLIWVNVSGEPRLRDGKVIGVNCLVRDVTERKRELEILRKSETRARAMVEQSPIPMVLISADYNILFVNQAFTNAFGYTIEDIPTVAAWNAAAYPDPGYYEYTRKLWHEHLAENGARQKTPMEVRVRTKSGGENIALITTSLLDTGFDNDRYLTVEDITARRQAEDAAKKSLDLLRRTEQLSGTGGWTEDLRTGAMSWTPEICRIADVDPDDPSAMAQLRRIFSAGAVSPAGFATRERALVEGRPWDREFEIVSATGRRKWVHGRGQPVKENGVVVALTGHMQDITERREAEAEVKRLNTMLHETQINAKIGGWNINLETGATTWTAGLYLIHDLDPSDTTAYEVYRRYLAQNAEPALVAAMEAAAQHNLPYELEIPRTTAKGRKIWIHTQGVPIVSDGKVVAISGFLQDVTGRKEAEMKLAQASNQLQATLDATIDGMTTIDSKGVILSTNRAMSNIFGYKPEEMLHRNVSMLMPDPYQSRHDDYLANHQRTGQKKIIGIGREVLGRRKDGTVFPLDLAVAELRNTGDNARYLGTIRDITARKNAEDQLRAAQKMEAVGQLTAGVAHDFNNLLAVISANLELLAEDVEGQPKLTKRIASALKASDRGAELTQHLLAFGRNQALSPKRHDLRDKVQDSARLLKRTLPGNILIEVIADPDTPMPALVDEAQFENALLNLGLNARDAMKNGGTLLFSVSVKQNDTENNDGEPLPKGRYVAISVQDTGTGMPADVMARVFDPFFTTKPVGQGSGLGLSMVYGFVRQSGGRVYVSSKMDEGTTFTLLFPLSEGDADTPSPETPYIAPEKVAVRRKVLVVEDIDDVRMAIQDQLETLDLDVITAIDANAALTLLAKEHFDLLLTDLGLPGNIDGDELADTAAKQNQNLKIITMTGYNKDRVVSGGVTQGPNRMHLRKPFRRAEIMEVIDKLFS